MAGGRTELEILIKTVADARGLQLTDAEIKKVEVSLGRAQSAASGVTRASSEGADAMSQFGRRGSEAKDAFEGLSTVARGGEGAIFGMAKAWRALGVAFAANPVTATLAVLLGLLPLLQKGFDLFVSSSEKARDSLFGTGERAAKLAENFKLLQEASEKSIKAAAADAEALADAYERAVSAVEDALRRFKEVETARAKAEESSLEQQRQAALAGAKSPEEKASINAKFDGSVSGVREKSASAINDKELFATAMKGDQAAAKKLAAERAIKDADEKAAAARQKVEDYNQHNRSAYARPGTKEFESRYIDIVSARNEAAAAEKIAAAVREKNTPIIKQSERDIADVDARTLAIGYERKTIKNTSGANTMARAIEYTPSSTRQAELRSAAESAQARGDWQGQAAAVAELAKARNATAALNKAIASYAAQTAQEAAATKAAVEKAKQQAKNSREGGG